MELFKSYLDNEIAELQSGASVGTPIVRKFPFTFATAGILTGAALYTPTVGDVLLDAWIEVATAWDGTTPRWDIGTFVGSVYGLFANVATAPGLTGADTEDAGAGYLQGDNTRAATLSIVSALGTAAAANGQTATRMAPGKFTAANPIKVVVSQDGTVGGADPGSTQGAAILYLITATPA